MNNDLVLTVISDDKPGVVETLAQTISSHNGNWLESRMAHLAGKFAGILRVNVPSADTNALRQALEALSDRGLKVIVEDAISQRQAGSVPESIQLEFKVVGNDRPGIVREIAQALASRHISVDELNTHCSSMPWSGEPLFEAHGLILVPASVDLDELQDQLNTIGEELAVEIDIEQPENEQDTTLD